MEFPAHPQKLEQQADQHARRELRDARMHDVPPEPPMPPPPAPTPPPPPGEAPIADPPAPAQTPPVMDPPKFAMS